MTTRRLIRTTTDGSGSLLTKRTNNVSRVYGVLRYPGLNRVKANGKSCGRLRQLLAAIALAGLLASFFASDVNAQKDVVKDSINLVERETCSSFLNAIAEFQSVGKYNEGDNPFEYIKNIPELINELFKVAFATGYVYGVLTERKLPVEWAKRLGSFCNDNPDVYFRDAIDKILTDR